MKKVLLILGLVYFGYVAWQRREIPPPPEDPNVVMYSLTTCVYCKEKRRELARHGIGYVEYFIDEDKRREDELNELIRRSSLPQMPYGTPIFAIYGRVIPDNPDIEVIKKAIARYRPASGAGV